MQRIRRWYLTLGPEAVEFFGDAAETGKIDPSMYRSNLQLLFTAASMVAAINAVVAGAAITLLLRTLGAVGLGAATAAGVLVAVALFVLHLRHERRRFGALVSEPDAAARGSATAGERRR